MKPEFKNLNPIEQEIAEYLYDYCDGINHAISNEALSYKFGIDKRQIRNIITNLIINYKLPIGSSSTGLTGIYWCITEEDYEIAHRELISRAKQLSKRAKGLRTGWNRYKEDRLEQLSFGEIR
jgi:hypothetical protein